MKEYSNSFEYSNLFRYSNIHFGLIPSNEFSYYSIHDFWQNRIFVLFDSVQISYSAQHCFWHLWLCFNFNKLNVSRKFYLFCQEWSPVTDFKIPAQGTIPAKPLLLPARGLVTIRKSPIYQREYRHILSIILYKLQFMSYSLYKLYGI